AAWLIRSAGTCRGAAVSSASTAISVGPASASMPTVPRTSRLAAVTQTLPGPVITSTGTHPDVPYANMAIACAPPTAYTSSTSSSAQAASTYGSGSPVCFWGGLVTAIEPTPATWAGTTFITTLDGYTASP